LAEGVFSPVTGSREGLDLNHACSSSPVMRRVPMEFRGPSTGDGFVSILFEDGSNMDAPKVFDGMTDAHYGDVEVLLSSYFRRSLV
jgi:hypothetical protein